MCRTTSKLNSFFFANESAVNRSVCINESIFQVTSNSFKNRRKKAFAVILAKDQLQVEHTNEVLVFEANKSACIQLNSTFPQQLHI